MCNSDFQCITVAISEAVTKFLHIPQSPPPLMMIHIKKAATASKQSMTEQQTLNLHSRYRLQEPKHMAL